MLQLTRKSAATRRLNAAGCNDPIAVGYDGSLTGMMLWIVWRRIVVDPLKIGRS
jgi:hypothetical protein